MQVCLQTSFQRIDDIKAIANSRCATELCVRSRKAPWSYKAQPPPCRPLRPNLNPISLLISRRRASNRSTPSVILASQEQTESPQGHDDSKLVVLTTLGCQYCRKTKSALSEAGIEFKDVDLSTDLDALKRVKDSTGRNSVPQVFADGRLLGGCSETLDLIKSGELAELVKKGKGPALPKELENIVQKAGSQSSKDDLVASLIPEGMSTDRYWSLAKLKDSLQGLATTHRVGLNPVEASFSTAAAKQWLQDQGEASDGSSAAAILHEMIDAHLLYAIDESSSSGHDAVDGELLGISENAFKTTNKKHPLNAAIRWRRNARPASQVAETLRQFILRLYDKHLADDGKSVKYKALASDPDFWLFVTATAELQGVDPTPLARAERIAFFLNIYNVLIVHAQAALNGPTNPFSSIKYEINGTEFSADAIEHGILRGNKPSAAAIPVLLGHPEWSRGFFKGDDPRKKQAVQEMDKRIHFALNCGAKSCPPIKVYTPEALEEGLQSAAAAFCEGEVSVDEANRTVHVSKVFKWYAMDFGSQAELLGWLLDYLPEQQKKSLNALLEQHSADGIKLKYKDYDWGLNEG